MADDPAAADELVDLLGDPWTDPKDPRGRPAHRRLPQVAEKVAVLRAGGSDQEQIALRLGISVKTLRKYYSRELNKAPQLARQVLLERMWTKALDGNPAAARFVREELQRGEELRFEQRQRKPGQATPPATPASSRLGKKAAADQAALTAGDGSDWGDDLKFGPVN